MKPTAIIAAATQGIKMIGGGIQAIAGARKMKKLEKLEPKYTIPTEVKTGLNLATTMAGTGMAAEQYQKASQQNQNSANFALRALQDRRSGLAGIGNIQQGLNNANLGLSAQDANMRQQNQRFLYSALMNSASFKDKLFANQWQSWSNKYQQARANVGAGLQNVMGGVDNLGALGMSSGIGGNGGAASGNVSSGYGMSDAQLAALGGDMRNTRNSNY